MIARYAQVGLLLLLAAGCVGADDALDGEDGEDGEAMTEEDLGVAEQAATAIADGDYIIKAAHSGKCLDIASGSTQDGASVQQWDCNGTAAQVFRVTSVGGGYVQIVNPNSGKVLDVSNVSTADGALIHQWTYVGGANQQFEVFDAGGGQYGIRARHSNKVLDVKEVSTASGAKLHQWTWGGGANQRFTFQKIGGGGGGLSLSGYTSYNFYDNVPATSTKCELNPQAYGLMVTAIRHDIFQQYQSQTGQSICGKCARVTSKNYGGGNGNTVVVRIIDESNDYSNNGGKRYLDMAPQAFQQIGNIDMGSIPVDVEVINCP